MVNVFTHARVFFRAFPCSPQAPAFERFRTTKDITEVEAKKVLEQHGVPHYWDLAKNFDAAAGLGI